MSSIKCRGTPSLRTPQEDLQAGVKVTVAQRMATAFISPLGPNDSEIVSFWICGGLGSVRLMVGPDDLKTYDSIYTLPLGHSSAALFLLHTRISSRLASVGSLHAREQGFAGVRQNPCRCWPPRRWQGQACMSSCCVSGGAGPQLAAWAVQWVLFSAAATAYESGSQTGLLGANQRWN